jgi:hypothetical protein
LTRWWITRKVEGACIPGSSGGGKRKAEVQDVDEVVEEVDIGEVATLVDDWVQEVVDEMVDYEEGRRSLHSWEQWRRKT